MKHWLSVAGNGAIKETASVVEDIRGQILSDKSMTIPSPTGDNGQQSNSIQGPTEMTIVVGTNTECSQLDNIAATIIKTHEELGSVNAQMVETLIKVYEFAEKLVQVNIKQEGVIKRLEEKLDSMERRERGEWKKQRGIEELGQNTKTATTIADIEDSFLIN